MSPFGAYLFGALLVIIGLAFGAYLLNVPPAWIGVGVIVAVGVGVMLATTRTRPPGPGHPPGGRYPPERL
jgi:hypothetical protein